ncbi:MAG: hypothetical protein AAF629_36505, partial [Chloroflexota bacterium]
VSDSYRVIYESLNDNFAVNIEGQLSNTVIGPMIGQENRYLTVTVAISPTVSIGVTNMTTITFVSERDESISQTITLTTTVRDKIYLPLIRSTGSARLD